MACLPGMPCFGPLVNVVYPPGCDPYANLIIQSSFVEYDGANLSCTGIQTCDTLTVALQKIDNKICSQEFVAQIIQTIANDDVLKAYFCQLVGECTPTTTTSTTTATPTTTTTSSSSTTTTTSSSSSTSTSTSTTTTTTTNCLTGFTEIAFSIYVQNQETSEYTFFDEGTVTDACNALALYLGGGYNIGGFDAYISAFEIGGTVKTSICTPVPNGTYINSSFGNNVFTVSGGIITDIVDCSSTTTTTTTI